MWTLLTSSTLLLHRHCTASGAACASNGELHLSLKLPARLLLRLSMTNMTSDWTPRTIRHRRVPQVASSTQVGQWVRGKHEGWWMSPEPYRRGRGPSRRQPAPHAPAAVVAAAPRAADERQHSRRWRSAARSISVDCRVPARTCTCVTSPMNWNSEPRCTCKPGTSSRSTTSRTPLCSTRTRLRSTSKSTNLRWFRTRARARA